MLNRAEEFFVASRLLSRARHQSKKLANAEAKARPLHPELMRDIQEDIVECTRIALQLQAGTHSRPSERSALTAALEEANNVIARLHSHSVRQVNKINELTALVEQLSESREVANG